MQNKKLVLSKYDKEQSPQLAKFIESNRMTCYKAELNLDGADDAIKELKELLTFISMRHGNDSVLVVVDGKGSRAILKDKRFQYRTFKDMYGKYVEAVIIQSYDAMEYVREFYRTAIEVREGLVVTVEFKFKTPLTVVNESNMKAKVTSTLLTNVEVAYAVGDVDTEEVFSSVFSYFKEMVEDSELNIALPSNHKMNLKTLAKYHVCDLNKLYQPYVNVNGHCKHEPVTKLFVVDLTKLKTTEFEIINFSEQFNFNETLDKTRDDYNKLMKKKAHRRYHSSNIHTDRFTNLSFEDKTYVENKDIKDILLIKVLQTEYVEDLDFDEVPNDLKSILIYLDADYLEPSLATEYNLTLTECLQKILTDKVAVQSINKGTSRRMLIPAEGNLNFTDNFNYLQKRYYGTRRGTKQYIFIDLDLIN